jgi:hypothetical protein
MIRYTQTVASPLFGLQGHLAQLILSPDRTRLPGRNGHSCIQARGHDSKPANFTVQPGHLSFLFGGHVGTIAGLNDGRVKSGRIPNQSPEGLILICLSYRKSASVS